jgi:hypothetical protein
MCFLSKIHCLMKKETKKLESVCCRVATASPFVAKVRGEVLAYFYAAAVIRIQDILLSRLNSKYQPE